MANKPNSDRHAKNEIAHSELRRRVEVWSRELIAESLGIDGTGEFEQFKVFEYLGRNKFFLPASEDAALRVLWGDDNEVLDTLACEQVVAHRHHELRQRMEAFAQRFFQLSAEERRRDWKKLSDECEDFPLLKLRLTQLQPGIDAVAGETHGELLADGSIGDAFQKLFVASRPDWPRIRRRLRERLASRPNEAIEASARRLQEYHPRIAALQPELFQELYNFGARKRRSARARSRRLHAVRQLHQPTSFAKVLVVVFVSIVISGFVFNMVNGSVGRLRSGRRVVRDRPSPPQLANLSPLSDEQQLRLGMRPGEQPHDTALRRVIADPENRSYRHTLGKELIQAAQASFGTVGGVQSMRFRKADEREEFYLRACQVLEQLVAEEPDSVEFTTTLFEACQRYFEHPQYLGVLQSHSHLANMRSVQQGCFQRLVETHLERSRPRKALHTLMAQREFSRRDPAALFRLSHQMASVAYSQPPSDSPQRDQELIDACTFESLATIALALNESLRQLSLASDGGEQITEATP